MDSLTIVNSGDDSEEEQLIDEIIAIIAMCDEDKKETIFDSIFIAEGYQKLYKRKEEIRKKVFGNAKQ